MWCIIEWGREEVERVAKEQPEYAVRLEKFDTLVKFSQTLNKYDEDTWSPLIKARIEKGLDELEVYLRQGTLVHKQNDVIKEASK